MSQNIVTQNINVDDESTQNIQALQHEIEKLEGELKSANKKLDDFNSENEELQKKHNELSAWQDKLSKKEQILQQQQEKSEAIEKSLAQKENEFQIWQEKNHQLEKDLESQRIGLSSELEKLRQKTNDELSQLRQDKMSELTEWEREQRTQIQGKINSEYESSLQDFNSEFANKIEKINASQKQLDLDQQKLDIKTNQLNHREALLSDRENCIEKEVEERIKLERESFENQLSELNQSNERLRESVRSLENEKNSFADLESRLNGQNPLKVLADIEMQKTLIFNLQEELKSRPAKEVQDMIAVLQNDNQRLLDENQQLRDENIKTRELQQEKESLEFEKNRANLRVADIQGELDYTQAQINKLQEEIALLSKPFGAEQNRQQRIDSLLTPPQIQLADNIQFYENIAEQDWLDNIYQRCQASGFEFPRRILNAFHTSLKTGEFSPITVLAGVSGTGKSQLPALYSRFGGINFLNVPVQPNWDSQEAMLGYFNSMTNHFDAQPVLRYLMQTQQERTAEYPNGLADMMNLILLDEMNLSHPELYFAEFLSKLEERRGKTKVPSIDINLGSGIEGYNLKLRRNVLWVGTMNQDETTKSLSDKVIDRSFIINFPRPKYLKGLNVKSLSKHIKSSEDSHYLTYNSWRSWINYESLFDEKEVGTYKTIIEQINNYMDKAGRALGHRVWQSVEYYMSNHPDVIVAHKQKNEDDLIKSMKIAFEDQLVQKVMPKLRGIETRGRASKNCLEPIQNLLDDEGFAIVEDFKHAREVGHGQFIWNSAYYLDNEVASEE